MSGERFNLWAVACTCLLVGLYALATVFISCGCTLRVGKSSCLEYVKAIEVRLTECDLLEDEWYREQLRRVYAQCGDTGPLGLTLTEESDVTDCVDQVRATSCKQIERGAPSCLGTVRL